MALTNDTVMLFLLLMPGFLSSIILNMLIVRKPPSGLLLIIEALVFSFVIYVCWGLLSGQFLVSVQASGTISPGPITRWALAGVMGLSIILPLALGALLTHDYLFWGLGILGVTRRTGRAFAWLDVFVEQRKCMIVNFIDGRRLFGWPEFYSDDVNEGMLYLVYPQWIDDEQQYTPVGVEGFLIVNKASIESIMVTGMGKNDIELEDYGEELSTQVRAFGEGTKLSSSPETGGRAESTPDSTDKTSTGSCSPTP